ncbi:hypothetical protein LZP73_04765 [Shewanella sp. AS16]|uniref:hypothetical protein n=1 Tax=Shewanella sp. AS16 TaxID=2907625 RepID=UPI001F40C504|nr:hypothetical protein [Shewanella sp. AS16]MCE9685530.1 hypothetical protein [Shewanella sp. AS16]
MMALPAVAGQVLVHDANQALDVFAVRDAVIREQEWQEALRFQQQLQILQALPLGCVSFFHPYAYYDCAGRFYRPYRQRGQENPQQFYIQITPPGPGS